jgi:molybdate transport system substrate-binding protein
VRVVAVFPESTHTPITYPVAATTDASPQARDFIAFLTSPAARAIFEKAGFQPLN